MLERQFGTDLAIDELAAAGLIERRGWAAGPGWVWIPTAAGETLYHKLAATAPVEQPDESELDATGNAS